MTIPRSLPPIATSERFQICREFIEALHPGRSRLLRKPRDGRLGTDAIFAKASALCGPTDDNPGVPRGARYAELLEPEGPIVFAGEHLSYQGLWQEGAALSAHEALKLVAAMARERPAKVAVE